MGHIVGTCSNKSVPFTAQYAVSQSLVDHPLQSRQFIRFHRHEALFGKNFRRAALEPWRVMSHHFEVLVSATIQSRKQRQPSRRKKETPMVPQPFAPLQQRYSARRGPARDQEFHQAHSCHTRRQEKQHVKYAPAFHKPRETAAQETRPGADILIPRHLQGPNLLFSKSLNSAPLMVRKMTIRIFRHRSLRKRRG